MPAEYLASQMFAGNGTQIDWPFSFAGVAVGDLDSLPYLEASDVKAEEIIPATETTPEQRIPRTVVLVSTTTARVEPAVAAGRSIRIYRDTQAEYPLVNFQGLQAVSEADLDLANRQLLFVTQETSDRARDVAVEAGRIAADQLEGVYTVANNAVTVAAAANSTATTALNTANAISGTANLALTTANEAKAIAEEALENAESFGVASFAGRSGAVLPQAGDYQINQITGSENASHLSTGTIARPLLSGTYDVNIVGNVQGNVTGNVSGNAGGTAAAWATARTLTVSGQLEGSASLKGDADVNLVLNPVVPSWTNLTFGSGWSWDSAGDAADYHRPSFVRRGDLLYLRGKATFAASLSAFPTTVGTLPVGFRPLKRKVVVAFVDSTTPLRFGTATIFIQTNGNIDIITQSNEMTLPATDYHILLESFPPIDLT